MFLSSRGLFLQKAYEEQIREKAKDGTLKVSNGSQPSAGDASSAAPKKRPRRWDQTADETPAKKKSSWDDAEVGTPSNSRWDATPGRKGSETPSKYKYNSISILICKKNVICFFIIDHFMKCQ